MQGVELSTKNRWRPNIGSWLPGLLDKKDETCFQIFKWNLIDFYHFQIKSEHFYQIDKFDTTLIIM